LAQGPQNIAGSIPESHTDFIYSILTEEFGAVGSILLISAFIYLLYAGIKVSLRHTDKFKRYMGISLSLLIALHAGVHICVASGAFPTKGITLPFISWGGSSLVAMSAAVGLILNLSRGDGEVALVHEVTSEGGDAVYVRAEP
jgi:cell division protein FtsW